MKSRTLLELQLPFVILNEVRPERCRREYTAKNPGILRGAQNDNRAS